jgi:hypothetical protein
MAVRLNGTAVSGWLLDVSGKTKATLPNWVANSFDEAEEHFSDFRQFLLADGEFVFVTATFPISSIPRTNR